MREWRPEAILATGGYVCAPVVLAGWLARVPSLVYLPDTEPGWAIRFLAPFAARIGITVPESARFFARGQERGDRLPGAAGRIAGHDEPRAERTLASRTRTGASWSRAAAGGPGTSTRQWRRCCPSCLEQAHVIHVCGQAHFEELARRRAAFRMDLRPRYHLYAYLHEMPLALAAADLAISRSGASVLGEYPAVGLPAILIPYAGGHRDQELNAKYLAEQGAAVVVPDESLDGQRLLSLRAVNCSATGSAFRP